MTVSGGDLEIDIGDGGYTPEILRKALDVQDVARKYMDPDVYALAIAGPELDG